VSFNPGVNKILKELPWSGMISSRWIFMIADLYLKYTHFIEMIQNRRVKWSMECKGWSFQRLFRPANPDSFVVVIHFLKLSYGTANHGHYGPHSTPQ
jgi:hypothetical protein